MPIQFTLILTETAAGNCAAFFGTPPTLATPKEVAWGIVLKQVLGRSLVGLEAQGWKNPGGVDWQTLEGVYPDHVEEIRQARKNFENRLETFIK